VLRRVVEYIARLTLQLPQRHHHHHHHHHVLYYFDAGKTQQTTHSNESKTNEVKKDK